MLRSDRCEPIKIQFIQLGFNECDGLVRNFNRFEIWITIFTFCIKSKNINCFYDDQRSAIEGFRKLLLLFKLSVCKMMIQIIGRMAWHGDQLNTSFYLRCTSLKKKKKKSVYLSLWAPSYSIRFCLLLCFSVACSFVIDVCVCVQCSITYIYVYIYIYYIRLL